MKMETKALLLVVALFLVHQASAAKKSAKKYSKQQIADEDGPPCGYRIIKRLENCCEFPDLIATDVFASCHEELKDTTPQEEGGMESAPPPAKSKKAKKGSKSRKTRASYKVGWGGGRSMGTYRGGRKSHGQAMCIYECVLRKQSLVRSDGEIDEAKMESVFVKASPVAWQSIIKEAFSTCSSQYKKVKRSSLPSPITSLTGRLCKYGPALFMSCIRGHLTLNCEKNSVLTIDAACKEKVEFLKTCNPFKVRGSSGKGGKYWGAVESEESATIAPGPFEREQMPPAVAPAKE